MLGRRILYAVVLTATVLFYMLYKQWLAWVFLVTVAALPLLSLGLSLPAMLSLQAKVRCPGQVRLGVPAKTKLDLSCRFPMPPVRCRIRLHNRLTGERYVGIAGEHVPVQHCGLVQISCSRFYVYDYLGLFRRKLKQAPVSVYILPKQVPDVAPDMPEQTTATAWKPKPGGGFSENYDLRPYRPGDNLRQIHWKLAAKTGQLIYKEPIEPVQTQITLALSLSGTPQELDRKLGRLHWIGRELLSRQQRYKICCHTGAGEQILTVTDRQSADLALQTLLEGPAATTEWIPEDPQEGWLCRIGGGPDEA